MLLLSFFKLATNLFITPNSFQPYLLSKGCCTSQYLPVFIFSQSNPQPINTISDLQIAELLNSSGACKQVLRILYSFDMVGVYVECIRLIMSEKVDRQIYCLILIFQMGVRGFFKQVRRGCVSFPGIARR